MSKFIRLIWFIRFIWFIEFTGFIVVVSPSYLTDLLEMFLIV